MKKPGRHRIARVVAAGALAAAVWAVPLGSVAHAAETPAPPATRAATAVPPQLTGRPVEEVRIVGRSKPLDAVTISEILRQVRTREGEAFDPQTVEADYQRIFALKKFRNVEARVEPTADGVIVIFDVTEQNQITEIRFKGNQRVETKTLKDVINIKTGEAIDPFRLGLAKEAIENAYKQKNHPYAQVEVDQSQLARNGVVEFTVVEGPRVRVRKVRVLGNQSFSDSKIEDQIQTSSWFPFFVSGTYNPDQVEQDVASIRRFYESRGFFDVRVGRKVVVSPDQKEVMLDFLVEEGPRYVVDKVSFQVEGNSTITESQLRENLKLIEGRYYDADLVKRDVKQIVKVYSPLGHIYTGPYDANPDPDYLQIKEQRYFQKEPGKVELVYAINEGKPFRIGQIIVKGNHKTDQKVVLRQLRVQPGQLYDSAELQAAQDRIRATGLFNSVTVTPIEPPRRSPPQAEHDILAEPIGAAEPLPERALLVEVNEAQTGRLMIGAGITSNSGVLGNISYEERNFDISNWPSTPSEVLSGRAFTGAGQLFRIQIEPGTELTRARVDFVEPWVFDQPYSFGVSGYISQRYRQDWLESRIGGRLTLGRRFSDVWSGKVFLRGEDMEISDIDDEELRAPEVLELEGHSLLTSLGLEVRRDTTDSPILPTTGTITAGSWEHYGALGGDFTADKFTLSFDAFQTVYEDLLDRRTIVAFHGDVGYITGGLPFFERFYGGGLGSVRGFRYRGISPRAGIDEDPIGGDFMLRGSVELNFPIAGDALRGVLFADAGTVEEDFEIGTVRSSVGFGFRLTLPFLGQLPIALDFGIPITKDEQDDTRIFSFALGTVQ